jgi:predicted enzyme related to lactoylglutathione lyase
MIHARYGHTNIVARDWRKLARFYEEIFGCIRILPERDLSGDWLDALTGIRDAHLHGVHLRLPGHGEAGPTLEIFQYEQSLQEGAGRINRPGLAHLAFTVNDVDVALEAVLQAGGGTVGKVVSTTVAGVGNLTAVYVTDPEGNIIELQKWS